MFPKITFRPPMGEGFQPIIGQEAPRRVETSIGVVGVQADGLVDLPFPCEVVVSNLAGDKSRLSCRLPAVKIFAIGRGHEAVVTFPGNEGQFIVTWES